MFCSKCGNDISNNNYYCDNCGEMIIKKDNYSNQEYYYQSNGKGLSITGFILAIVSFIITLILLVWVNSDGFFKDKNVIIFGVFGLTSVVLIITGFILSVIGVVKTKDAFGITGIVLSVVASIFDIITLCTAVSGIN